MSSSKQTLNLDFGKERLVIQRRYEALGAFNDLLIAIWFLIGSFFFSDPLAGTKRNLAVYCG
ncbi:MAG: YrhK family protein [Thiolinea sp.]